MTPSRLYIAVRSNLPPGLQAAQAVHAAFHLFHDFPSLVRPWIIQSNFLVIVAVPDEDALLDLITEASRRGITRVAIREPDLDNEATAVALAPGKEAQKLCASLPLALKEKAVTCICDPDESYGYDSRCRVHGHSAEKAMT